MKRPKLNETNLDNAMNALLNGEKAGVYVTMSVGQWDSLLQNAYDRGWILLELDDRERPIRAYRRVIQ